MGNRAPTLFGIYTALYLIMPIQPNRNFKKSIKNRLVLVHRYYDTAISGSMSQLCYCSGTKISTFNSTFPATRCLSLNQRLHERQGSEVKGLGQAGRSAGGRGVWTWTRIHSKLNEHVYSPMAEIQKLQSYIIQDKMQGVNR